MSKIDGIIESLDELKEEDQISKLLETRIDEMIMVLREDIDLQLRVDRVRSILEELDENQHTPMFIRTQLWNISAALELL